MLHLYIVTNVTLIKNCQFILYSIVCRIYPLLRYSNSNHLNIFCSDEVGFAQIHMECSETVACKHNLNRPSPLPEDIITKMSLRMQKPDGNTAWEKLHIIIPTGELDTRHSFDFQRYCHTRRKVYITSNCNTVAIIAG